MCIWDPDKNGTNFRIMLLQSSLCEKIMKYIIHNKKVLPPPWCYNVCVFLLPFCQLCILQLHQSSLWTFPLIRQHHQDSYRSTPQLLVLLLLLHRCCELHPSRGRLCISSSMRLSLAGAQWTLPCCRWRESWMNNKSCTLFLFKILPENIGINCLTLWKIFWNLNLYLQFKEKLQPFPICRGV